MLLIGDIEHTGRTATATTGNDKTSNARVATSYEDSHGARTR